MEAALIAPPAQQNASLQDPTANLETVTLSVPEIVCGNCIRTVETALRSIRGVSAARANLALHRVTVTLRRTDSAGPDVPDLVAALKNVGYTAAELVEGAETAASRGRTSELIPRVGVAGFAAANIMLLSVSVWSGEVSDMDSSVRDLFHWVSALIALPAIAYAGQPFFRSAFSALRARRLNMDVPISLGILLATAMSLFQTIKGSEQVYFDAATTLVFFLLIGRTLDESMRVRARGAAENLLSLRAMSATVVSEDGSVRSLPARALLPGMRVAVAAGERIPADGIIASGVSEIDESLITGETVPRSVAPGAHVHAGTVNGGGILHIRVTVADENTLLAEIGRLMIAAEQSRGRYVRLADRAAQIYAPAVHVLGLLTFTGWMLMGSGWELSLTHAIAVLIITCPCALALAVPAVQVAAMSRLFRRGVIVKAADGLERMGEIDSVVFDKTGTLTLEQIVLADDQKIDSKLLARVASLAVTSRHPYAQAIVRAARDRGIVIDAVEGVQEVPGSGLSYIKEGREERLGSAHWVGAGADQNAEASLWYKSADGAPIGFRFFDLIRPDAGETVKALRDAGYAVELLSGDRPQAVARAAAASAITDWQGALRPSEKLERIGGLRAKGHKTLMVGDGLNDAPALAAGYASMSPASAVDISQAAADAVFQGDRLEPVVETLKVAQAARRMALQNFAIAIGYNAVFVPIAMLGHVTPLVAALAMSTSSIVVTANAIRLRTKKLRLKSVRRYQ
ncbi:heavy metal translocating P-type ATPase [Hyphomicrobium sp. 99]|uniref:heavy metal translocating P-type ATPase n=1 Tax=Hyphomicrobium sp. 99 TaxID=1163419 RepID=UPI0005F88D86|nr:heavy metal translocating P-type ATPase [Hyphomicrobium sp. 99]